MFIEFIERLREKPEAVRKRFALFTSLLLTGSIAAVWLSVLLVDPEQKTDQAAVQGYTDDTADAPGIWERMRSAIDPATTPDEQPRRVTPEDLPPEAFGEFRNTFTDTSATQNNVTATSATSTTTAPTQPQQATPPAAQDTSDLSGFVDGVIEDVRQ